MLFRVALRRNAGTVSDVTVQVQGTDRADARRKAMALHSGYSAIHCEEIALLRMVVGELNVGDEVHSVNGPRKVTDLVNTGNETLVTFDGYDLRWMPSTYVVKVIAREG